MSDERRTSDPDPLEQATTSLVRVAQSDRSQFEHLYRRVAPSVFAWARLRLRPPVKNVLEPEDVVEEVWCRALDSLNTFDPARASFRTWIFAIANHVLLKGYRRLTRAADGAGSGRVDSGEVADLPDDATSISRRVTRDESLERCIARLRELDDDERKLLIHCGLEGLTSAQTAKLMGMTADAVAKRWQRLRSRLSEAAAFKDLLAP
jgi:RNA polymerase sigma-70 factor, ECF subfamily